MGIDGAGKAYQKFYAHNTFVPGRGQGLRRPNVTNNFFINQDSTYMPQTPMFGGGGMCMPWMQAPTTGSEFLDGLWGFSEAGGFNALGKGLNMILGNNDSKTVSNTSDLSDKEKWAKQLDNLKAMYGGKGFNITSNDDGTFNATDKNSNNVALKKDFDEMCKILGENQGAAEVPTSETDDEVAESPAPTQAASTESNELANSAPAGSGVVQNGQRASSASPKDWYRAQSNKNQYESSAADVKKVEAESQLKKQSNARIVVTQHILKSKLGGALSAQQITELTKAVIKKNPSVFNDNGSFKKDAQGTVQVDKLDLPSMAWIKEHIIGDKSEDKGPNSATAKAKSETTEAGNTQYNANKAAQEGYRETFRKGIFYDDKTKTHYELLPNGKYKKLQDVKMVLKDGSWIDTNGIKHKESIDGAKTNTANNHAVNNGKTHTGSRQPWL